MKVGVAGIELIKKFEGLRLDAYLDAVGVWTIGYGSTGSRVYPGLSINQATALQWLYDDLTIFENAVATLVKVPLNENQFAALVSFAYNCGAGALANSTALKRLNNGDYSGCCEAMQWYNKGNNEVLQGLVNRRKAEVELFNSPVNITKMTSTKNVVGGKCKIKTLRDTTFNHSDSDRAGVRANTQFKVLAWKNIDDYLVITLDNQTLKGKNTWHVKKSDIVMSLPKNDNIPIKTNNTKILKVPYLSQLDNVEDPYGTCNVTSVAMCMGYFGHPLRHNDVQLEDELNQYCNNNNLNRHVPEDLAHLFKVYGYVDNFSRAAKWSDVKSWLNSGNPTIVHGWFTASGHIIVICGYNESGWVVLDPYGEYYATGYDTNRSGANLTYSYKMMREVCGIDGDLWIHYVSK